MQKVDLVLQRNVSFSQLLSLGLLVTFVMQVNDVEMNLDPVSVDPGRPRARLRKGRDANVNCYLFLPLHIIGPIHAATAVVRALACFP